MLTPTPQMMLISHRPKLAPATLSAATQPVPKKINSAVPRNSAMHWLESDGCFKAVVIENLIFLLLSGALSSWSKRDFHRGRIPILILVYCRVLLRDHSYSIRIRKNIEKKR